MSVSLCNSAPVRMFIAVLASFVMTCASHAQTQASCTFQQFTLPSSPTVLVNGVNDYGSVVGNAVLGGSASPQTKAFLRYSNGDTMYWLPSGAKQSSFNGRNNNGVTTGAYFDASNNHHAFILNGSTMTPITNPADASPIGINKFNSIAVDWRTVLNATAMEASLI